MFALTLEKIPSVVDRIDMDIEMVNSSFNMNGTFPGRTGSYVFVSNQYRQQVKDSITLTYVTAADRCRRQLDFSDYFLSGKRS